VKAVPFSALIAAGGTTGHLSPGLAVGQILRSQGARIMFVGTLRGPEARIVAQEGFPFQGLHVSGRGPGALTARNARAAGLLVSATIRCLGVIRRFQPDVVLGTGGFPSLPAALAARVCGVPLVIHEQNATPGLANRIAGRFANEVALSFPSAQGYFRTSVLTGNPVRAEIVGLDRDSLRSKACAKLGLDESSQTLMIFGGSQGASAINDAAVSAYSALRSDSFQVLHIAGPNQVEGVQRRITAIARPDDKLRWRVLGYLDHMELGYAAADLVLCRAGASTIAELAAVGLPAVFVPLPIALDDDQRRNAEAVVGAGGGRLVPNQDLTPEVLAKTVRALLADLNSLQKMSVSIRSLARPGAARDLADLVTQAAKR